MNFWKQPILATAIFALMSTAASAANVIVYDTSLANVNGVYGAGVATTTDLAGPVSGRVTTTVGAGGGASRASAPVINDVWSQQNVGGGGSVGITTQYARNGNGSAVLGGVSGDSKSDLEIRFAQTFSVNSITGLSYDWYRDSASVLVNGAALHPSLRLLVTGIVNNVQVFGSLIYEHTYNAPAGYTATTDAWVSENIAGAFFWASGGLPDAFARYDRTLSDWSGVVNNLTVYGLSFGAGSGWTGTFSGAVDNITLTLASGASTNWNFEVQADAVPEPGSLALAGLALAGLFATSRRIKRS